MADLPLSTRRDQRFGLDADPCSVAFEHPAARGDRVRGKLVAVSISGISFHVTDEVVPMRNGTPLQDIEIEVADRRLRGDAVIRNTHQTETGQEFGCVFYPASPEYEDRLMELIQELESAEEACPGT